MLDQDDMTVDWWKERTAMDLEEPSPYPHEFLTDFFGQCVNGNATDVRVLVPLCGKSAVDIKWLYGEGCCIYGVDASEKALQKVFAQLNMKYDYTPPISGGFGLLKSKDDRIKLFCGDVFRFTGNVAGSWFDLIWDRGAFMTVSAQNRETYINTLQPLLLPTGRIMLAAFVFDSSKWRGPPYPVTCEEVHRCFGRNFHINILKSQSIYQLWHQEQWGIDWLKETGYMLSLKT